MFPISAIGLGLDLLGATILVVADLPQRSSDFASYCPQLKHVERARVEMTTRDGGREVWLKEGDRGHKEIIGILEERLERDVSGDIRSNRVGREKYTITIPDGVEYRDSPLRKSEFSSIVKDWEARYIRRLGLGILMIGFAAQIGGYFI